MAGPDMSVLLVVATDYTEEIAAVFSVFISLAIFYVVLKANLILLRIFGRERWD